MDSDGDLRCGPHGRKWCEECSDDVREGQCPAEQGVLEALRELVVEEFDGKAFEVDLTEQVAERVELVRGRDLSHQERMRGGVIRGGRGSGPKRGPQRRYGRGQ